jgi:hypothetical protein
MKIALIVAGGWLAVTTLLTLASGWYRLAARYPNRIDEPLLRIHVPSGSMGLVGMRNLLTLSPCPSGLRVSMFRLFGPFCRPFFVPWDDVAVLRTKMFFAPAARLQFGKPIAGTLAVEAYIANELARAAGERWPEAGPIAEETRRDLIRRLIIQWAIMTGVAALVLTVAPLVAGVHVPISLAILFPAIGLGIATIARFVFSPVAKNR